MHCCNESSDDQRFLVRPAVFCESLTFWTVFSLPPIGPISCVRLKCSVSPFSCFLRSSILSRLSQSAELRTEILSQGDWLHRAHAYVCVLVFKCVHKGTAGCISKVMVTNPYLFFFFLPFPRLVCVFCYLRKVCMDTSVQRAAEV